MEKITIFLFIILIILILILALLITNKKRHYQLIQGGKLTETDARIIRNKYSTNHDLQENLQETRTDITTYLDDLLEEEDNITSAVKTIYQKIYPGQNPSYIIKSLIEKSDKENQRLLNIEAIRQEAIRQEAIRQEAIRQENIRQENIRQEDIRYLSLLKKNNIERAIRYSEVPEYLKHSIVFNE